MKASEQCRAFIADHEKRARRAYKDSADKWTIGIGHLIADAERATGNIKIGDEVVRWASATLTDAQIDKLFEQDLAPREAALTRMLSRKPTQEEFDAMLSLMFNIGQGRFATSSVRRLFNIGATIDTADAFRLFNKETIKGVKRVNEGLRKRREQERAMFLNGIYDSTH